TREVLNRRRDLLDGVQQTTTGVLSGLPDVLNRAEHVLSNPAQLRDRIQSRVQHVFELTRSTPSRDALLEPLSQIRERPTEPRHQPATDRRQVHERLGQRLHTRPGAPSAPRQIPEEPLNVVDSGRRREHVERVPHHAVELLGQLVHTDPQSPQKPTGRQLGDLPIQTSEQVLLNRPPNQLELGTKSTERLNRLPGIRRQPLQSLLKLRRSLGTQRLTDTLKTNNQGGDTRSSTGRQRRYQRQSTGSLSQPRTQTDRGTTDTGHSPSQRTQSRGSQGGHSSQTAELHHRHQQTPAETETNPLHKRPDNADTRETTQKPAAEPNTGFLTLITERPVEQFALPHLF